MRDTILSTRDDEMERLWHSLTVSNRIWRGLL